MRMASAVAVIRGLPRLLGMPIVTAVLAALSVCVVIGGAGMVGYRSVAIHLASRLLAKEMSGLRNHASVDVANSGLLDPLLYSVVLQRDYGKQPRLRLVVVIADGCVLCDPVLDSWLGVLKNSPRADATEICLIDAGQDAALSRDRLIQRLEASHVSYRVLRPKNYAEFWGEAGITDVPTSVMLGVGNSICYMAAGAITAAGLRYGEQVVAKGPICQQTRFMESGLPVDFAQLRSAPAR